MPFDSLSAPAVTADPTLADLSAILRDCTRWPAGFEWDFRGISTCAMGLCRAVWGGRTLDDVMMSAMYARGVAPSTIFGLDSYSKRNADVTPEDVADAIDAFLSREG